MKQKLPGATGALVCGILSVVLCFFYGLPGLVLGIVGLTLSKKAIAADTANPGMYDGLGSAKAGKILSLIGTILSGLYFLLILIGFLFAASLLKSLMVL
ncbi:MAG: CCC motif membrane protein [Bacteroidota bacterium]|jgi:hypothetical protein